MTQNFFTTEPTYKEMTEKYKASDSIIALVFYTVLLFSYLALGILYVKKGVYFGIYVNLFLTLICIGIVLLRKQKLSTIGLTLKNMKKSVLWGLIFGGVILFVKIIPPVLAGRKLTGLNEILYNGFYYFIVIAFVEEIVFRGYLQTRLYGIIKSDVLAVVIGGLLFSVMHIPFQMYNQNVGLLVYLKKNCLSLLLVFLWHIVFNFLYRKNNSLAAPTIMHGIMDFSSYIFK